MNNTKQKIQKSLKRGKYVLVKDGHPNYLLITPIKYGQSYNTTGWYGNKESALQGMIHSRYSLDSMTDWEIIDTYSHQELIDIEPFDEGEEVIYNLSGNEIRCIIKKRHATFGYHLKEKDNEIETYNADHRNLKYPTEQNTEQEKQMVDIRKLKDYIRKTGENMNRAIPCLSIDYCLKLIDKFKNNNKSDE